MEDSVPIGSMLDGRYRIEAVLGSGGMGKVYKGQHTGIGRTVAIKVLHNDLSKNPEAAQRFQREAIASGRLDHPNIVTVSDSGVLPDGSCYLVMEALEGESLGERLDREHRIAWPDAIEIIRGVLRGLGHAHERGVVHRDIKPDNIFLARKDGSITVKILDFGIAKLYAGNANDPASTRAGLTVGTPAYLSPEQAVGGEITPAADLYSTTIMLFEMLAGRTPFIDSDPLSMLGMHVGKDPPRVAEIAPDIVLPAGLEEVIAHGLGKLASERIASAPDYLARLDAIVPSGSGQLAIAEHAQAATWVQPAPQAHPPAPLHMPVHTPVHTPVPVHTPAPAHPPAPLGMSIPPVWIKIGWIAFAAIMVIGIIAAIANHTSKPAKPAPAVHTGP